MSLRDQLLAKGLVSRKDVRRVEQELRSDRKQTQGARRGAAEVAAEERAAQVAAEQAERDRRLRERKDRELAREIEENRLRLRQMIRSNAIRSRGPFRYFHRTLDTSTSPPQVSANLGRMDVSERVAFKLRCGEVGIAAFAEEGRPVEYVVVSARALGRIEEFAPWSVVTLTRDTSGISDASEALWKPEWEISLQPHRLTPRLR
jgi:uncharacterized protein YaiL (DUF2058 family)